MEQTSVAEANQSHLFRLIQALFPMCVNATGAICPSVLSRRAIGWLFTKIKWPF